MPDDYYVSQYSGEEIDDLLGKAGSATGAVRYDAAQTLTDAQKAQARDNIAAAPSGFGWGEESPRLVSTAAEVDAITANSVVRYANNSTNLVDGDSNSYTRYAIVVTYTVNATDKAQDVYCYGGGAHGDVMLHRGRFGNTWLPWEWVNPPMNVGVEYRTTERYLGKPVYCKLVNFGALPNATQKVVKHNIPNVSSVISVYGSAQDQAIVVGAFGMQVTGINADNTNVAIWTSADLSNYSAYVAMKYTKITD